MIEPWRVTQSQILAQLHQGGRSLIDAPLPERTQTLTFALQKTGGLPELPATVNGGVVLKLNLLSSHAYYARFFNLGAWQFVQFPCAPYRSINLAALSSTIPAGWELVVVASDGIQANSPAPLLFSMLVPVAGVYDVPPGAFQLVAATADPAFAWISDDQTGAPVVVPMPTVAGGVYEVCGTRFLVGAPFSGVWRERQ